MRDSGIASGLRHPCRIRKVAAGARWCLFRGPHERREPRPGRRIAPHPVPVDAERERRIGMPALVHYGARIDAERREHRRERVPQLVRCQVLR